MTVPLLPFAEKLTHNTLPPHTSVSEIMDKTGTRVYLSSEGLPMGATLPNGMSIPVSSEHAREAREKAMRTGEPELITIQRFPGTTSRAEEPAHTDTKEHPVSYELPNDVLPTGELGKRGIEIIQADTTQFYVREGAFETGEPFSDLKKKERELIIVFMDSPAVSKTGLMDKRYDKVRDRMNIDYIKQIQAFRKKQLEREAQDLEDKRNYRKKNSSRLSKEVDIQTGLTQNDYDLLRAKTDLYFSQHQLFDDQETLQWMINTGELKPDAMGDYSPGSKNKPAIIFLAVGKKPSQTQEIAFYFTPQGELKTLDLTYPMSQKIISHPLIKHSQTHPNPEDFELNPNASPDDPKSYPYGPQTLGQSLGHEGIHELLMGQAGNHPNRSEYDTDMLAMMRIRKAWEKWVNSEYTDNSGFYFIFSLPEGGYIYTKNEEQPRRTLAV